MEERNQSDNKNEATVAKGRYLTPGSLSFRLNGGASERRLPHLRDGVKRKKEKGKDEKP